MFYWLSSYPRSGNSWTRAVLSNLTAPPDQGPADIDALIAPPVAINRELFDAELDCTSSEMTTDEVEARRHDLYLHMAAQLREPTIVKLHCANRRARDGRQIFPPSVTAGVVLIVRNPLDVAVSLAPFMSMTQDAAIDWMAREDAELGGQRRFATMGIAQRIGSWSSHSASWLDATDMRIHLVRYEELQADPHREFGAVAAFLGLDAPPERLAAAIDASRFDRLRAQELERVATPRFYRQGKAGGWREALSPAQVERIRAVHGPMMQRLDYD